MIERCVRAGVQADAGACAAILNDWIDKTPWMPRIHSHEDVLRYYSDHVLVETRVFVAGDPPHAFLALDKDRLITALYSRRPKHGLGKALLDHVKTLTNTLCLWTFQSNTAAQRFYMREDFRAIRHTDGDNEEGLPDILYRWDEAHA